MDLNVTNLWFQGREHMSVTAVTQVEHSSTNYCSDDLGGTALNLGCLGTSEAGQSSRKEFSQSNHNFSIPDDGCRLVLGLGPTPNLYRDDGHSSGGFQSKEFATLFGQSFAVTDPGMLKLELAKGSSRTLQPPPVSSHQAHFLPRKNGTFFPVVDEGSTSAKRKSGGYMPSLLFAPRPEDHCSNTTPPETQVPLDPETGNDSDDDFSLNQHQAQYSPEPSATTDCSFPETSDMVVASTSGEQRSHHRHPKKCRFNGCSKGARGASGLCISHGGGQRCQKAGCNKGAESRTAYCKAHGGGKRCQELGCTKSAEGKTEFCIAHGGGRRCGTPGCTKAARGKSGLCIKHGGGKRCQIEGCARSAEGQAGLCISHGGGRRCQYPECGKGAQGSTIFCKAHGGGKRCIFEGCTKGAEGSTPLCKGHGGGKRCLFEGGGVCPKSVHGGTNFCVAHGGGKRCAVPGCTKSARGRTDCCVKHGGGKRCKFDRCDKSAQGSTDFCKAHGGGKRCTWSTGCEKFARGRSGLCAAHGTQMASRQQNESGHGRGMIGPGLFSGIVSTSMTVGSSMDNDLSSSGLSTLSDSIESLDGMQRSQLLIPPQVLVPVSMKCSSSCGLAGEGQEDGRSQKQSLGFLVPEGRVHGGGLMSLLRGNMGNALDGPEA